MIASMVDHAVHAMLELAYRLSFEAAAIAIDRSGKEKTSRKADDSVVTDTDRAIEALFLEAISATYPNHAVCAEESANRPDPRRQEARYCWVIDPLDGTRNFAAGLPCFSTSVAVLENGSPVVAVVLEHHTKQLYTATYGDGARLNGEPIRVAGADAFHDRLIGVPSSKDPLSVAVLGSWLRTKGMILRNLGSTAMHLALVASGALDAAFCKQCKIWDIAAGALLISEAGGLLTDEKGHPRVPFDLTTDPGGDLPILAAGPATHRQLLASIAAT